MVAEPGEVDGPCMQVQMQQGLEQFFMGRQTKLAKIDMAAAMKEVKLHDLFHDELWSACTAVRELATQIKGKSFVYSDLEK